MTRERVEIYDVTLRDGMGGEGMSLSAEEQLRVAHVLDGLGIPLLEAGFPESNPKDAELFALLAAERFETARVAAFGMTRRRGVRAEQDPGLRGLAESFAPVVTLVGKGSIAHVHTVLQVSPEENLAMLEESFAFLVAQGKRAIFDAEHFFDGYALDRAYSLDCLRAAVAGGVDTIALCDTNGGRLPHEISAAVADAVAAVGGAVTIGIHTHNDSECAVANSIAAVVAGARHVQGTLNGYGERTGNANLISIIPALQLKLGFECIPDDRLEHLTASAHFADELVNFVPNPKQPYVGKSAFAHKAGMHASGIAKDPATFEHMDPAAVGNDRAVLVSELAGRGTVRAQAENAGLTLSDDVTGRVVERLKEAEHAGYHYEAADGSFDLLIRREAGEYEPLFRLESWRVIAEKREDGRVMTEATIKIWVDGERYVRTAEGNGPVHALDRALRDAIGETYPHLRDVRLVNYKVRILEPWKATGAVTRVLLDASDGTDTWGAIGVSENVIEASWEALVDSLEAGMLPSRREHVRAASTAPAAT